VTGPIDRATLVAYALPGLPIAMVGLPLYIYLPSFYAVDLGLGLGVVGAVLLAARLWDIVVDLGIGELSDRIHTRFGRRRPWLILALPVICLAVELLFRPVAPVSWSYLLVWTMALYLGWTMFLLPYGAWGAELSTDYHERSRIAGARETASVVGTLVAVTLPALVGGDQGDALNGLALAILALLPPAVAIAVATVSEPPPGPRQSQSLAEGYRVLARNRPFRRLILAYLFNGIANGLPATLFLMFVQYRLQAPAWAGPLLLGYFLLGIASVPLWVAASRVLGKHRAWTAAMAIACLAFAVVPFIPAGGVAWFALVCVVTGLCLGADLALPSSMWADVVDWDTAEMGTERAGLLFALWGVATKLALALAVGIAFPLLEVFGFVPGAADGSASGGLLALAVLYAWVPVAFKLAAGILVFRFEIDAETQAGLRRRIEAGL
jgi:glycoside/pentoside/hexuronide:cation symporter, GPH family